MKLAWHNFLRLLKILRILLRHGFAHLLGPRVEAWRPLERWLPMAKLPAPERLRILLEDLGGTYIKFGQMLALQPDILSLEYCNALFTKADSCRPSLSSKAPSKAPNRMAASVLSLTTSVAPASINSSLPTDCPLTTRA